jgi:hypothetical protein
MNAWFADTAGWANWLGRRELFHDLAAALIVQALEIDDPSSPPTTYWPS